MAGNAVLIGKARKAGGVWKAAKRSLKAKDKRAEQIAALFGEAIGVQGVVEGCT